MNDAGGSPKKSDRDQVQCGMEATLLPNFAPGQWDVICQRGKESYEHVGNRRFRIEIDQHLDEYVTARNRQSKSKIVSDIVDKIRSSAQESGGGFVRKDLLTRKWSRVGDKLAREKVGQALRDAMKTRRVIEKKQQRDAGSGKTAIGPVFDNSLRKSSSSPVQDECQKPQKRRRETENQNSGMVTNWGDNIQIASDFDASRANLFHPTHRLFENQLSAELEPTPIPHPTYQEASRLAAVLFGRHPMAAQPDSIGIRGIPHDPQEYSSGHQQHVPTTNQPVNSPRSILQRPHRSPADALLPTTFSPHSIYSTGHANNHQMIQTNFQSLLSAGVPVPQGGNLATDNAASLLCRTNNEQVDDNILKVASGQQTEE